jgi:hypothetical protein
MSVQSGQIERLFRDDSAADSETFRVDSPGGRNAAMAVKVVGHHSYNVYKVKIVELGPPGSFPMVMSSEMLAVNLAESFSGGGSLASGTYTVMFRVGQVYAFYVEV